MALGEPVSVRVRVPFTPENVLDKFEHAVKKTKQNNIQGMLGVVAYDEKQREFLRAVRKSIKSYRKFMQNHEI